VFSAFDSLDWGTQGNRELPRVPHLQPLYDLGLKAPRGEAIMIAGRSGTMKSMFALWWTYMMGVPTLYFSADMSPTTVGLRLASMLTGHTDAQVTRALREDPAARAAYAEHLAGVRVWFEYGAITWAGVDTALDAYVSIWDDYPTVVVLDNLMDVQGATSEYSVQMEVMASATDLARAIDAAVVILHHATDKTQSKTDPWIPPARSDVKGGLSEKPALAMSVAYVPDSREYRMAIIKQRNGPCDPSGNTYATLYAQPDIARFYPTPQLPGMTSTFTTAPSVR
jgi:hypothetical protein